MLSGPDHRMIQVSAITRGKSKRDERSAQKLQCGRWRHFDGGLLVPPWKEKTLLSRAVIQTLMNSIIIVFTITLLCLPAMFLKMLFMQLTWLLNQHCGPDHVFKLKHFMSSRMSTYEQISSQEDEWSIAIGPELSVNPLAERWTVSSRGNSLFHDPQLHPLQWHRKSHAQFWIPPA